MISRKYDLPMKSILFLMLFTASTFAVNRDQAEAIAIANAFGNQVSSSNVMMTKNLLPANSEIKCLTAIYSSPANPSWLFFSDDYPGANWSHAARVAFVDAVTGECQLINVNWPPVANSDKFVLDYDTIVKNVEVAPDPKGLATTPLNSNISRNIAMLNKQNETNASSKYAVLICGGYDAGNLHVRYHTDLQEMYATLVNTYQYPTANIYVLCADGDEDGNGTISFDGMELSMDLDGDGTIDCNTAASKANVTSTFQTLSTKMTSEDFLFVFTTDHGSNIASPPSSVFDEGSLTLWDYEEMRDDEFAAAVNQISNYSYQVFCFEQCFSGDMINDLWGTNRVIATAANWDEYSWGRVFSALWISAVNGSAPDADVDSDNNISMQEAFDYAQLHDQASESPQYYESDEGLGAKLTLNGLISQDTITELPLVKVQINTSGSDVITNSPQIQFKLFNVDQTQTVDLEKIEIRYWIASETTESQNTTIELADYSGTSIIDMVSAQLVQVQPVIASQTHYMSVQFSSDTPLLPPDTENNVFVQLKYNKADWTQHNQSDDWSYIQTTDFVDAYNVAVYYDGWLVWGNEPSQVENPTLKVQANTSVINDITNQLYINVRIYNTGTIAEAISTLDLKYWYSEEGTQPEVVTKDWVGRMPSGENITSQTQAVIEQVDVAGQTGVVHLSFPNSSIYIEPNGYIEARLRVNKTDWTNYSQTNDYSFIPQSTFTDCDKICLYKNNALVWGNEP